ncbi:hypothetical protein F5Y05DRAFT_22151 [Hypoxylon sp. FL0543]|nr:hypothetical protein F5Y05DRAFT_22151 [Hypoxylon sp. FL0543]
METAAKENRRGETIIPTPAWFIALRVLQIVFALINIALTGWWIHGLYYDELGFVIVCGLFTWVIAVYAILAEKAASCRRAYNTWAILSLDGLMIIFWLAAMAATANRRGTFNVAASASCVSDGSTINSGHCAVYAKRDFASNAALGVLSGIAGISAIIMLLFVATFAYVCHYFRLSFAAYSTNDPEKASAAGLNQGGVVGSPGTELQGGLSSQNTLNQHGNQQWTQQAGYSQQTASQPQYPQGQAYEPYATQNSPYSGAAGGYPQQPEQTYNLHSTPAPGQPYSS